MDRRDEANAIESVINELHSYMLNVPPEEEVFKEGIDKRVNFSEFVSQHVESIIKTHLQDTIKLIDKKFSSITLVGGSRSWDKYINKDICNTNKKVSSLSPIEKAAIVPGNFDIFCFCSDKSKMDYIIHQMCICFDKIIKELNDSEIGNYFELHWDNNGNTKKPQPIQLPNDYTFNFENLNIDCPVNVEPLDEGCVFPSCNSIDLELIFSKHPDLPKNAKGIKRKDSKKFFDLEILEQFNRKVLLYFEIVYLEENNQKEIKKLLVNKNCKSNKDNLNYLNLEGLYLLSELIVQRGDKDYDIDLYRKQILDKIITENKIDIKEFYKTLLDIYSKIFTSRSDYAVKQQILLKKYIDILNKNILNDYSSHITETLRPFINTFILEMHHTLQHDIQFNNNTYTADDAYIFVTGGDAYRRYLFDIKKTNDIDTKILFKHKKDENTLSHTIVYKLSELLVALYTNKDTLLKGLVTGITLNDTKLNFRPVYKGGQFRLRLIKRDDFNLFSVDYRYKLDIINDDDEVTSLNMEVAVVDVVLQHSPNNFDELRNTNVTIFCGIPVASNIYLTNDLKKMYYQINENLRRRYQKSSKDKERFVKMIQFIKKHTPSMTSSTKRKERDELPDLEDVELKFVPKRIQREIKDIKNHLVKINELCKFQTTSFLGNLEARINFNVFFESIQQVKDYVEKYTNKFFELINNKLQKEPEASKFVMQFNDIADTLMGIDINTDTDTEMTMDTDTSHIDLLTEKLSSMTI